MILGTGVMTEQNRKYIPVQRGCATYIPAWTVRTWSEPQIVDSKLSNST